jgi:hypothetical protein
MIDYHGSLFAKINSQVREQRNLWFKGLTSSVQGMTYPHFMLTMVFAMYLVNANVSGLVDIRLPDV